VKKDKAKKSTDKVKAKKSKVVKEKTPKVKVEKRTTSVAVENAVKKPAAKIEIGPKKVGNDTKPS
jgi:hypothetical protein